MKKLRVLAAAYEAANNYDSVPDEETAITIPDTLITAFTVLEFKEASNLFEGCSPRNIVDEIIHEISQIK
jgi:hypothetical protein